MKVPTRLLVIATHPIQYQAPWFRHLAQCERLHLEVAFLDMPDAAQQGSGFEVAFEWDVPITDGYDWRLLATRELRSSQPWGFLARRMIRSRRQLRDARPDAVLVLGWNQLGLLQAWLAARTLGLPVVVRGDSNAKRGRAWWKRALHGLLLSQGHAFLAVGESNREFYRHGGVPAERIFRAPHFVDNAFFSGRAELLDRTDARASLAVPADSFCVLFAGKFEAKKRPRDLLLAVAKLPEGLRKRVHVLMVGAGALGHELRQLAASLAIDVSWAGFLNQSEISRAYRAADVLVLPSDHGETWGLVVNEAMACGVPAIVSDSVGCANDLVRHGTTGMIFPTGNVDVLATAIEALAGDAGLRATMGGNARQLVTSEYSIETSTTALLQALDRVVGGNLADARLS
jgi:glycosyltransferase involved in cell wall biosynthesis